MTTMRAAVLRQHGGREQIGLEEVPRRAPGPGEVRIRVQACALNWLDVGIRRGPKFGAIPLPLIGGADVAGTVDALGAGVVGWQPGDEVIIYPLITCGRCEFCLRGEPTTCPAHQIIGEHLDGGLAEYMIAPAANLLPKPARLSWEEAAAVPVVFMTAWHMLFTVGGLRVGESALVLGAGGGVASAGIQLARHAGATVYTTTSTAAKAERARELGAAYIFDYHAGDWVGEILAATGGRGVDLVQDNVGGATWAEDLRVLARNGRLVACGSHSGSEVSFDLSQIYHRQLRILGANGGTLQDLRSALALIEAGHVRPVVSTTLPLEKIQEAHRLLEEHDHFGKVVILMA